MTTSTEPRFKSLGEIFEAKLPPEEFAKATKEYHAWADKEAGVYETGGTTIGGSATSDKLKLVGTGVVGVGATMTAAGAGPFGAAVAAAGAVVIGAGHVHKINGNDEMEDPEFELSQADPLTGETADVDAVGNSDVTPIGRFPHWADAESATESEAVGNLRDRPRNPGKVNEGLIPDFYASWKDSESATETEAVGNAYTLVPERVWRKINGKPQYYDSSEVPSNSDGAEHVGGDEAKSDLTPEANALEDIGAKTEAIGHHGGPHPVDPEFGQTGESILKESGMDGLRESGLDGLRESGMDGLRESGMDGLRESDPLTAAADSLTGEADESTGNFTSTVRRFFSQSDSVTGDVLANADAGGSFPWFQMHHDDGIQDGYLDVGADASGFDSFLLQTGSDLMAPIAEPFADAAAITDLVTGKSSPMETATDPLVSAGPLDAVKVDEPRNNDF